MKQQKIKDKEKALKLPGERGDASLQRHHTQKSSKHKQKEKNLEFYTKGKGEVQTLPIDGNSSLKEIVKHVL